ncbi:MAG: 4-hydroxybenzoate octaprenyltransferase [Parvularculaceae bacterium]|nr:4-hydroxybenzoate octaprenyltransferase [Parvularculaceae bacterium]
MITAPADAPKDNWVDRFAPERAKPYLRLMRADRPIGTWLLLIPCWQGLALAGAAGEAAPAKYAYFAILFAIGAFLMRGAGCAYNDIVDRDFDARVARTSHRPIPSGQISVRTAWLFLAALCLAGLIILLQFNTLTIALGLSSLLLVAAYPFMKRITWWPQAWLGLTFNWGALMGYSAIAGKLGLAPLLLYAAGLAWTLGYDTIYAHQDKEDDALIGVKSSARALGEKTRPAIMAFYAISILLAAGAGLYAGFGGLFLLFLAAPAAHFAWQARRLKIDDSENCLAVFKSNREAGLLVLAALLLAVIV